MVGASCGGFTKTARHPVKARGTHDHHNRHIISHVVQGKPALEHSTGHLGDIPPGEGQRLGAGTGVPRAVALSTP